MKKLTNTQSTIAFLAIWFVVFLILWLAWEISGRDFHWWTTAIYAAVIGVSTFISTRIVLPTQNGGKAPPGTDH